MPLILLGLLLVGILVAAGWYFINATRPDDEGTTVVVTEYQTAAPQTTRATPTATPSTRRAAIETVTRGEPGSNVTSEAFADSVFREYDRITGGKYVESLELTAYSPVTNQSYRMKCKGEETKVVCRGGDNAVVVIR